MNDKKQWVNVKWLVWSRFTKRKNFRIRLLVHSFCFDKDDNVEEEGNEDKDDAAEDPNSKRGQSRRIGGSRGEGRVEHVHQNLFWGSTVITLVNTKSVEFSKI